MSRRLKALVIGLGAAVLAHGAVALWIWSVFDRLPGSVVTHWGVDGPDGFTPRDQVWLILVFGFGLTAVVGTLLVALMPKHGSSLNLAAGITAGLGVFVAAAMGGAVTLQAGRTEADPLELQLWWLLPVLVVALVVGIVAGRLVGSSPSRPAATAVPARSNCLPENDGRRDWERVVSMHPAMLLIAVIPLPVFVILAVATGDWTIPLILTVLVLIPILGMWQWRLQVDREGLRARGWFGWPTLRQPLREIESAEAIRQVYVTEYGGPGLRVTRDGERLALRSGPGLRVALSDGTDFVVTTPDADTAARTLNTLIAERR